GPAAPARVARDAVDVDGGGDIGRRIRRGIPHQVERRRGGELHAGASRPQEQVGPAQVDGLAVARIGVRVKAEAPHVAAAALDADTKADPTEIRRPNRAEPDGVIRRAGPLAEFGVLELPGGAPGPVVKAVLQLDRALLLL